MNEENVIQFPDGSTIGWDLGKEESTETVETKTETVEETNEEVETTEEGGLNIDPDDPLTPSNEYQIRNMIKDLGVTVQTMSSIWENTKNDFAITQDHINALKAFNSAHAKEMPENITDEEKENWNPFNGLYELTEDNIIEIFGEDHPLSPVNTPLSLAIDRCSEIMNDLQAYINVLAEYKQVHDAYIELIENEEAKNIEILKVRMESETDPEKKAAMQSSLDSYYSNRTLGFLAEELDEKTVNMFVSVFHDSRAITYRLQRGRKKLNKLSISEKSILEISQFEKRYLPEKYECVNNMLLLYFLNLITYSNPDDKKDPNKSKAIFMAVVLDKVIRNAITEDYKNEVLANVMKFDDQFIDAVKAFEEKHNESNK